MSAPLNDEIVTLDLTGREVRLVGYVLTRAAEDPDFFDALGGGDHRVGSMFRMMLGRIRAKTEKLT